MSLAGASSWVVRKSLTTTPFDSEQPIRDYAPPNEAEAALLLEICGMEWMKPEAPKVSGMFETYTTASGQVFE